MPARLAPIVAALAAVALAACGKSDDRKVRDTVESFGVATVNKDYDRICQDLISRRLLDKVEAVGIPCDVVFRRGLEQVQAPRLKVVGVEIVKDRAKVRVVSSAKGQPPSNDVVELVKEGDGWKIAALARPERRG